MRRIRSSGWLRTTLPAAAFIAATASAYAATWTVHVGRGGTNFVDDTSGTSTSTIAVGDTVTWIWEGAMQHSVTSGTCTAGGNGGGGGGYGGYGGGYGGGGMCKDAGTWPSSGFHTAGFQFSEVFSTAGTFPYYCMMHLSSMTGKIVVQAAAPASACPQNPQTLCLNGGRFAVTAHWTKPDSTNGDGTGVSLTDDSGYFWFFDSSNIETTVKVLSGCGIDNAYWVFAAGLTNVDVLLTVLDTKTNAKYTKENPQGAAFAPIQDTGAFKTSCP